MQSHLGRCLGALLLVSMVWGCASTRYVEDGSMLLSAVHIEQDSLPSEVPPVSDLLNYVSQRPNHRLFGLFNWSLGIYNLNNIKSNSWLNRRLRRWGDPPVIFNRQEADYGRSSLSAALYNRGFLHAEATYRLDTIAPKKVRLTYQLHPGALYQIEQADMHVADSTLLPLLTPVDTLALKYRFPSERYTPWLTVGSPLAPEKMQLERRRLTQILRNRGYWSFREEYIHFDVDTLAGHQSAWLRTSIDGQHQPYRIGRVRLLHAGDGATDQRIDSTRLGGIDLLSARSHHIRPRVLARRIWIRPDSLYTEEADRRTYSALADLAAVGSINIQYRRDTLASVPTLDCDIVTTAERSKEFAVDLVGTHSSGNLGANASIAFGHNNLLGGAEEFKLLGRVGYENLSHAASDHLNYGLEASLSFPRPFISFGHSTKQRPLKASTDFSLSYDHQRRPEFTRDLLSASWGYSWRHFASPGFRYALKLVEVDYMRFGYINKEFIGSLPMITRLLNYRDQFVVSSSIQMTYSSANDYRYTSSRWLHNVRLYAQSAGNALYGMSALLRSRKDSYGAYSLMNINFAQFVKAELDYSGLFRLRGKNALAYHAALAMVYPYSNSRILPVDLRYFSGGANSLRGWGVRSLGPGAMPKSAGTSIFHQVGDIKLDLSTELRTRIAPAWELALFVDAGNIWTIYPYEGQPAGEFRLDRFYEQIALSSGLGLRWDFDFFLLRLDMGFKLHDPQADRGRRWVVGRTPIRDLTAVHFAIGYPF